MMQGVLAPVVTPFDAELAPDPNRFIKHCQWLISQGCGLAVFGTNSEANSLSLAERKHLLELLSDSGVDSSVIMPGTGCCALSDTVDLTRHAVNLGVGGVLMLPPFYYKDVSDDGLYRYYAEVIERVGDHRLKIYLYHIPPIAQVPISLNLIERLLKTFPDVVVGIKDSSGNWSNTEAMLTAFPGFRVFVGSETFLLQNMRSGGVGCISATANVNPAAIHKLWSQWRSPEAEQLQSACTNVRNVVAQYPMIAALKEVIAHYRNDQAWQRVRPPLDGLSADQQKSLRSALSACSDFMATF